MTKKIENSTQAAKRIFKEHFEPAYGDFDEEDKKKITHLISLGFQAGELNRGKRLKTVILPLIPTAINKAEWIQDIEKVIKNL